MVGSEQKGMDRYMLKRGRIEIQNGFLQGSLSSSREYSQHFTTFKCLYHQESRDFRSPSLASLAFCAMPVPSSSCTADGPCTKMAGGPVDGEIRSTAALYIGESMILHIRKLPIYILD